MAKKAEKVKVVNKNGAWGGVYFLAMIASAVYFAQQSHGFWGFVLAMLKALVWPVFVTYRALVLMDV
jgi:hypothetical protein